MKNESGNLAIVSNNTFDASRAANLHHYDISSALQTTLEFEELINIFSYKIQTIIPHSGFIYQNDEFKLEINKGIVTRHSCTYVLKVEETPLGSLKIMRRKKFSQEEIELLESLLCSLIYPLKNATLFNRALKMAYTDQLTGTHNRASFNNSLHREIQCAKRSDSDLSLIFLDIDHFKHINDSYGHECGDIALSSVANCIKETVRGSDIVFRYGGEEFVILLNNTDLEGGYIMAERIRKNVEAHTIAYGMDILKLTVSLGVSSLEKNDAGIQSNAESLIKRADNAMYRAKQQGRNQTMIEPTDCYIKEVAV